MYRFTAAFGMETRNIRFLKIEKMLLGFVNMCQCVNPICTNMRCSKQDLDSVERTDAELILKLGACWATTFGHKDFSIWVGFNAQSLPPGRGI
jgi:hypothetical protein